jgi:plastocyanin
MKFTLENILSIFALFTLLIYLNACNTAEDNREARDTPEGVADNFEEEEAIQAEVDGETNLEQDTVPMVERVELEAKNFVFLPPEVILSPGQEVVIFIKNNGETNHSFELHLPSDEIELGRVIPPGQSDSLRIKMPTETGEYKFYCPVDNHHSMGMQGLILIQE